MMIPQKEIEPFAGTVSTDSLLLTSAQVKPLLEPVLLRSVQPTKIDKHFDELWESLVSERSTHNSLSFRDVVELAERRRVSVGGMRRTRTQE